MSLETASEIASHLCHYHKYALKIFLPYMPESKVRDSLQALIDKVGLSDGPVRLSHEQRHYICGPLLKEISSSLKFALETPRADLQIKYIREIRDLLSKE